MIQGKEKQSTGSRALAAPPVPTLLPQVEQAVQQDQGLHSRSQELPQGAERHHLVLLLQHGLHSPRVQRDPCRVQSRQGQPKVGVPVMKGGRAVPGRTPPSPNS